MRIAVYVIEFPAISETFILEQIKGLLQQGHDVRIIARRPGPDAPVHDHVRDFDLLDRTMFLSESSGIGSFLSRAVRRPRTITSAVAAPHPASVRSLIALERCLQRIAPDVVHCHFGPNGAMLADLAHAGAVRMPFVTSYHGIDLTRILAERGKRYYARLFREGARHLPVSHRFAETLVSAGCPGDRVRVHHVGVPVDQFEYRARTPGPDDPMRVLSVARLVTKKAIGTAVEAVVGARDRGVDIRYTIVGDGPLRPEIEAIIDRTDARDVVDLAGWQTIADVRQRMAEHDVLMAPSITAPDGDMEGIPTVLMEAMACGMPVISTLHSGIPELIEHGRTGFLIDEGDLDGLTRALCQLNDARAEWSSFGQRGREVIERDFNAEILNDRLAELLRDAIDDA